MKKLEVEKLKMVQSKQREDELWVAHEIESRYNSELLQLTQKFTAEIQQLTNELVEEDSKFQSKVAIAEEKAEQEFVEKKSQLLSILNSLKEFETSPRTLNEELLLEEEMQSSDKKSENVRLNKKQEAEKEVPVENRDRSRLNSQSTSQVNTQKQKVQQTKTYSSGSRENNNPSTNIKKTTKAASQSQPKIDRSLSWMDSDDEDLFKNKASKRSKVKK